MREIEIKVRVRDGEQFLAVLDAREIKLSEPIKQHDVVYGQTSNDDGAEKQFIHGGNWLRIRTENDHKVIFTLKRSITGELDSIEHEVIVDSAAEMEAIIRQMNYELYSDLTKIRRQVKIGSIELCYDEVPGLGNFAEIEKLCPENVDRNAVLRELWKLAEQYGLSKAGAETSGYDVLLRQKEGKPA